ncbi:MAG: hypothetical protein HGGPFJEG_01517 [Ignavibacteria bacterium]|nr:hypothetical protein [Ignavibacteria bacterium]
MKTLQNFCLPVIVFLITVTASAQNQKAGIKAGMNLANISFDENATFFEDVKNHTGFQVFVDYEVYENKLLTISAESGYILKGFENNLTSTNELGEPTGSAKVKNKMNFLDLSANLKFVYRSGISPFLSITPSAGIYLGGSSSSSGSAATENMNAMFETLLDSMNSVTFGFKFGAGAEFNNLIKSVPITAEIRYEPDLTKIYDKNSFSFKNKALEFNLGVKF